MNIQSQSPFVLEDEFTQNFDDAWYIEEFDSNSGKLIKKELPTLNGVSDKTTFYRFTPLFQHVSTMMALLGRSSPPSDEPSWLKDLNDEAAVKGAIVKHAGKKLAPKQVEEEYRRITANREVRRNIDRMRSAGSTVVYHSVDIRDDAQVQCDNMIARVKC